MSILRHSIMKYHHWIVLKQFCIYSNNIFLWNIISQTLTLWPGATRSLLYPIKSHDPKGDSLQGPVSNGEKIFCSIMEENPLIVAFHSRSGAVEARLAVKAVQEWAFTYAGRLACIFLVPVVYITTTYKKDKWIPFSLRKKGLYFPLHF